MYKIDMAKDCVDKALPTEDSISEICMAMNDLLHYKNDKYGDAALKPKKIFSKLDSADSICVRLDDKLSRVMNCSELRTNDICDIIGYLTLLLIAKGVKKEDIERFKD